MAFDNLSSRGLAQSVRDQILAAINRGEYKPGDKLPPEAELGQELGVSRVSIREALRSLEAIDLVEVRHGRGSFVAEGPRDQYRTPFAEWLQVHREEVLELMKVRGALDELAAAEAAIHADDAGLVAVETEQERFREATIRATTTEELIAADVAFHLAIAQASGSTLLYNLLDELNKLFAKSRDVLFSIDNRAERSVTEHDAVVSAIRSGEEERARAAVSDHLDSSRQTLTSEALFDESRSVDDATS